MLTDFNTRTIFSARRIKADAGYSRGIVALQRLIALIQIVEQIRQGDRLPFADRLIERNIQCLFFLRVFDVNDHAVDLRRAFRRQHLIALVAADDVARDLVPDNGIHIAEFMQAAPDLFVGRIAGLQVFAGIVFRGLQAIDADPL